VTSPGAGETPRIRLLDDAFVELQPSLREPSGLGDGQRRYAFRFGVALRDAEQFLRDDD